MCRRAGATPPNFWAAWPQKSGVAPARFSLFSTVTFPGIAFVSPLFPTNCPRQRVIKQEKKKVEAVILTFFTLCRQGPVRGHQFDGVIPS